MDDQLTPTVITRRHPSDALDDSSLPMLESVKVIAKDIEHLPGDTSTRGGYIVLGGRDGSDKGQSYTTRWRVDLELFRNSVKADVLYGDCIPCLARENRRRCPTFTWHLIRSDPFLLTLRVFVILVGVIKVTFKHDPPYTRDLVLIHSVIETFVTIFIIVVRVAAAHHRFRDHGATACQVDQIDLVAAQNANLRPWLHGLIALGVSLSAVAAACFLVFFFYVHLAWTILSNNFCLILISVSASHFMRKVNGDISSLHETQYKAVLYEALLLMHQASGTRQPGVYKQRNASSAACGINPETCGAGENPYSCPDEVMKKQEIILPNTSNDNDPKSQTREEHSNPANSSGTEQDVEKHLGKEKVESSKGNARESNDIHSQDSNLDLHPEAQDCPVQLNDTLDCLNPVTNIGNGGPGSSPEDELRRFQAALLNSPLFQKPAHIVLREDQQTDWDVIANLQSCV